MLELKLVVEVRAPVIDRLLAALVHCPAVSVQFGVPKYFNNGEPQAMATQLRRDATSAVIPLIFRDAAGNVLPASGLPDAPSVVVDDTSAADATTDGTSVTLVPKGAAGATFSVTYTQGPLTTSQSFELVDAATPPAAATSVEMDVANMVVNAPSPS